MRLYADRAEPTVDCHACGARYRRARASCPRCQAPRAGASRSSSPGTSVAPARRRAPWWVGGAASVLAVGLVGVPSLRVAKGPTGTAPSATTASVTGGAQIRRPLSPATSSPQQDDGPAFLDGKSGGRFAYSEGRLEDALASFEQAIAADRDDAQALNGAGQVLVRLGRADEAVSLLERAVEQAPASWEYRFNLARAHGEAGEWDEAVNHYRQADAARPGHHATVFNLARALERHGSLDEAVVEYRRAAELAPADAPSRLALALACERANDLPAARVAYAAYLELVTDEQEAVEVKKHLAALDQKNVATSESPQP